MRVLEIDEAHPTHAKRCRVQDSLRNHMGGCRRGSLTGFGRQNASKGRTLELVVSHPSPGSTPGSLFVDAPALDRRKAGELAHAIEKSGNASGLHCIVDVHSENRRK